MIDLARLAAEPVDGRTKGMPGNIAPLALGAIGKQGWNLLREDLPLPVAVLRQSALAHNGDWMRRFLAASGAFIAPHGKTTMSPALFERQIVDGAWAITIGSVQQLQVARHYGCDRVVLANQLVGARGIRYVMEEIARDPAFDFYAFADSVESVQCLAAAAAAAKLPRPLQLLVEGGFPGARTGCRTLEGALAVARAVAAAPQLALRGSAGYEGVLKDADDDATEARVTRFLDFLVEIALACEAEELFAPGPILLSAGGSTFYDMVVQRFAAAGINREPMVLIRSGCYLTHDSGEFVKRFNRIRERSPSIDALGPGLRPALEVWAYVQSRPEPTKALLTMGRRDVSFDQHLPQPVAWFRPGGAAALPQPVAPGHVVTELNDQHCHLRVPADSPLAYGDMVAFGISHPCTTFDKWQLLCVVDDRYDVVDAVRTYF
jgi:D-serine dehydratase